MYIIKGGAESNFQKLSNDIHFMNVITFIIKITTFLTREKVTEGIYRTHSA